MGRAFEDVPEGGLSALPAVPLVLGFSDPLSTDPTSIEGVIPQSWYIEYEAAYPVDVWSSADGVTWQHESQHKWPGKAECSDAFAALVEEIGPAERERRLVALN